jgi:hypothetical protein
MSASGRSRWRRADGDRRARRNLISKAPEKPSVKILTDCCTTVSQLINLIALNAVPTRAALVESSAAIQVGTGPARRGGAARRTIAARPAGLRRSVPARHFVFLSSRTGAVALAAGPVSPWLDSSYRFALSAFSPSVFPLGRNGAAPANFLLSDLAFFAASSAASG